MYHRGVLYPEIPIMSGNDNVGAKAEGHLQNEWLCNWKSRLCNQEETRMALRMQGEIMGKEDYSKAYKLGKKDYQARPLLILPAILPGYVPPWRPLPGNPDWLTG